jgi:hypothetical protein
MSERSFSPQQIRLWCVPAKLRMSTSSPRMSGGKGSWLVRGSLFKRPEKANSLASLRRLHMPETKWRRAQLELVK